MPMRLEHWIQLGVGIATVAVYAITVWAILRGPVRALQIQRQLDEERETRNRRVILFKTLMAYRATRLAPAFVQALNMIELEFDLAGHKLVRDAWKELLDHFYNMNNPGRDTKADADKSQDLLAEL
ncbi:MAG TPA: DUF6680 family protein, partial [Candidatus Angelobacter sp.]